ncbi:thiamine biosynthetic bifunctional enzyme TH1 [Cucumis melo var. makuwa]|uniref:Thiamine biosynthetic bifunctional enzyme TH1 n=1 Tax=Cucumis melo var. makuwa TaxID=1194695 RepID=A0A5A7SX87_CUCMM|nr:thiamine biosynthetic bifunctional enzyme TH1 [Cucumis melo var. makuwa]
MRLVDLVSFFISSSRAAVDSSVPQSSRSKLVVAIAIVAVSESFSPPSQSQSPSIAIVVPPHAQPILFPLSPFPPQSFPLTPVAQPVRHQPSAAVRNRHQLLEVDIVIDKLIIFVEFLISLPNCDHLLDTLNQMDSTDMELECDESCETSKIVRDEDTDGKRKTIDVDLDSYGREDVPNPPKIRKNVKQSMVWDHFERLKGDLNDPRAKCDTIGKTIEKNLKDWGIERVITLTVDNASSNDTAVAYLLKRFNKGLLFGGEFLHVRCCAHILNLIVTDAFKEHNDCIDRIRYAVRFIRSSPARFLKFKKCIELEKVSCKSYVCLDVPTKWNSTYMMLEAAVKFEKTFDRLEDEDASYRHDMSSNKEDWTNARMLIRFFKVFYDVTLKISGSLYTTSNLVFHQITVVQNCIHLNAGSANALLVGMTNNMKAKFEKYWENNEKNNLLLYVAIMLDPRKKLRFVSFCLKNFFGPEVAESMGNVVEQCCRRLFHEYSTTRSGSRQGCSNTSTTSTQTVSGLDANIDFDSNENVGEDFVYDTIVEEFEDDSTTYFEQGSSEIDIYLLEANVRTEGDFDILQWWKMNNDRFEVLGHMTKDILTIPVSTVASESAFSTGGRVVDSSRSHWLLKQWRLSYCLQNPISFSATLHSTDSAPPSHTAFSASPFSAVRRNFRLLLPLTLCRLLEPLELHISVLFLRNAVVQPLAGAVGEMVPLPLISQIPKFNQVSRFCMAMKKQEEMVVASSDRYETRIPHVLSVAGSDSGAGAGIQADLKTCAARGVYCSTVITAITAQNTVGVQDVNIVPEGFVSKQLKSVLSDMQVDVVKTGMLPSTGIVQVLHQCLKEFPVRALVVDPVMVSTSGDVLAGPTIISVLQEELLPMADLVTPNLKEASALLGGMPLKTISDMRHAATLIHQMGSK